MSVKMESPNFAIYHVTKSRFEHKNLDSRKCLMFHDLLELYLLKRFPMSDRWEVLNRAKKVISELLNSIDKNNSYILL